MTRSSYLFLVLPLGDGREAAEAEAIYPPPCEPSKILCVHLNYELRRVGFHVY